jgi:glycosyltransferase involved in cell wall biosynthesis
MLVLPKCEPERMPAVYRSVDAVLVPARYEAFGYVALEAMACGLPVIGFNASGVAEVCRDGETALLAPVDDIEMLEQLTRQLAADPELRERLGQSGRFRAVQCFDEEQAIRKYLDIYRQVMKSGYYAED